MQGNPRLLQIGASGQLAKEVIARASARGVGLRSLSRADLDLSEPSSVAARLAELEAFDVVLISAAFTAVDNAETDAETAHRVNCDSVREIGEFCAERSIPVIHVSTDYVFDGSAVGHLYSPEDPVNPQGAYGRTKLAGEKALALVNPNHVIIRTAWVFSASGTNFLKTMLRVGAERDAIRVVSDQLGCPTSAGDLAEAALSVAITVARSPKPEHFGVFHYAGDGVTSWCEFAREIFALAPDGLSGNPVVEAITTSEYPTQAKRPANSALDCSKLASVYGIETRPWRVALREVLGQIAQSKD